MRSSPNIPVAFRKVDCLLAGAGKGLVLSVATPGQGGISRDYRSIEKQLLLISKCDSWQWQLQQRCLLVVSCRDICGDRDGTPDSDTHDL